VETVRSQDRQDWLDEQGRSRPGQVVTWTRDSAHTRGEAVDVIVDGSWNNPESYERLQRIAREEGLRTLGARDPGHLELVSNGGEARGIVAQAGNAAADARRARPASSEPMPVERAQSGVARVAGVAGVAGVARVAEPSRTETMTTGTSFGATIASAASNGRARPDADAHDHGAGQRQSTSSRTASRVTREDRSDGPAFGAFGQPAGGPWSRGPEGVAPTAPMTGTAQAERVAELQQRRADAPATPLNRVTLNVDGANGVQERITLDVRGNTVSTHIRTDAQTADALRLRTAELQDALGRHGLDAESVRVSAAARPSEGAEATTGAGSERDVLKLATVATSSQDGAGANSQQGRPAREWERPDDARREQARARDERERSPQQDQQDQQARQEQQRRQNFFLENA
jgi:hypothetical protein